MKVRTRVGIIVFGLGVALSAAVAGWLAWRPIPPVTVVVQNNSQQPIALVRVEHERGVEIVENLARGEAKTIRFQARGETSYTLRIRFADGSEINGNAHYAEAGYEFFETVSDSGIENDVHLPTRY